MYKNVVSLKIILYFQPSLLLFTVSLLAALIDQRQCAGSEPAVQARLESLASQWETLVAKSAEKSDKLKEASRQQTYNAGVKDIEFWLGEVRRELNINFQTKK